MKVKGDSGIEFELADEVATAMITAGILKEATPDDASDGDDAGPPEADLEQETSKKAKK